ncbi:MAG TPA: hypothetical protein VGE27_00510 [Gemmatimonas sp.]|uniref:hypothetical protein n=1 Tax=Gemmatimonas sp. TaxID=1962908 RepID=UPI002EDA4173
MTRPEKTIHGRFDIAARLPEQVFRRPDELVFAFSDSALLTAFGGWEILKACAQHFKEDRIFAVVVDQVATIGRTRVFPTLSIESEATREIYINWLDEKGSTSAGLLYIDARTVAFSGSSGEWGLWIDQDRELAVLGGPRALLTSIIEKQVDGFVWVPASAVEDLLAPSFFPEPVSVDLLDRLVKAYGRDFA